MIATGGHLLLLFTGIVMGIFLPIHYFNYAKYRTHGCSPFLLRGLTYLVGGALTISFATLMHAYLVSDFTVWNVVQHSHTHKPLLYKITGVWGNHEGSILLYTLLLAISTVLFMMISEASPSFKDAILTGQLTILFFLLLYILFTSNPFIRTTGYTEGLGLNPLLQDVGLAIHPPLLYIGYALTTLPFTAALSTLLSPVYLQEFVTKLRSWVLLAWGFLTLGVMLGSWWAYRELGWGGFWFWDPVENASLLPWLMGLGLIHLMITARKRNNYIDFTLLVALFTYLLSMMGMFLVRSGLLISVHSFATDPLRGLFIFIFVALITMASIGVYLVRAPHLPTLQAHKTLSRETVILLNAIVLITATLTILFGTYYPMAYTLITGKSFSVVSPYYNSIMAPLTILFALLTVLGQRLAWQQDMVKRHLKQWGPQALISGLIAIGGTQWLYPSTWLVTLLIWSSLWLIISIVVIFKKKWYDPATVRSFSALRPFFGWSVAHLGFGIALLGITIASTWDKECMVSLTVGKQARCGEYVLELRQIKVHEGANYIAKHAILSVNKNHKEIAILTPEIRFYPAEKTFTAESSIEWRPTHDLYATIDDHQMPGPLTIRLLDKPGISLIWLGGFLMAGAALITVLPKKGIKSYASLTP